MTGLRSYFIITFCLVSIQLSHAQTDTLDLDFGAVVFLDSVTISASQLGYTKEDFIDIIQNDSSLLKAFRNYRFQNFESDCQMEFKNIQGKKIGSLYQKVEQRVKNNCRQTFITEEKAEGKIYNRKKELNYLTASLYQKLFLTPSRKCDDPSRPLLVEIPVKNIYQYQLNELKKLIFAPGSKSDIPLMGNMTEIFSKEMSPFYQYQIETSEYQGESCYVFTASVHPDYINDGDKTVIKYLRTYFRKKNFQVIAREYHLEQTQLMYQFKVSMKIEVIQMDEKYLPSNIYYKGFWRVPFKKEERGRFDLSIKNYQS